MGQYGNQPDFGTSAIEINPTGAPNAEGENLGSAALYIGTGGDLVCKVIGGIRGYAVFKNIPSGTFFPVIVSNVFANDGDAITTTCADIVALY